MAKFNIVEQAKAVAAAIDEKVKTTLKGAEGTTADDFLPLAETTVREAYAAGKASKEGDNA